VNRLGVFAEPRPGIVGEELFELVAQASSNTFPGRRALRRRFGSRYLEHVESRVVVAAVPDELVDHRVAVKQGYLIV
jgi:hypothetical protein